MKSFNVSRALVLAVAAVLAGSASGAWELSLGPAWRSRVKSRISGSAGVAPVPASFTVAYDQNIATHGPWTGAEPNLTTVVDPSPMAMPGDMLWAATAIRTETTVTPSGSTASLSSSEKDPPMGIKASARMDILDGDVFSAGLNFKFAGFWDMKSEARGYAGGGTTRVDTFTDYYLFGSGPYPPGTGFAFFFPSTTPYLPYRTPTGSTTTAIPALPVRAKLESDLYQAGIGPTVSMHAWEAFEVYATVEALCNIAAMDFRANGMSGSSTDCRLGFGAEVGCVAWISEHVGLYAEAGYEWIDEARARIGRARADVDYSSLIVSVGLMVGF